MRSLFHFTIGCFSVFVFHLLSSLSFQSALVPYTLIVRSYCWLLLCFVLFNLLVSSYSQMLLHLQIVYCPPHKDLLIHCLLLLSFSFCYVWSLFCYAVLSVLSSFAIISLRNWTGCFTLTVFFMSSGCVLFVFLTASWAGL